MINKINEYVKKAYEFKGVDENCIKHYKKAWELTRELMLKENIKIFKKFEERFETFDFLSNWIQDYEMALDNIYYNTNDKKYLEDRIKFVDEVFKTINLDNERLIKQNFLRSKTEAMYLLGEEEKAIDLIEKEIEADETWGFGYIEISDWFEKTDAKKSAEILIKATEIPNLEDLDVVLERMEDLIDLLGKDEETKGKIKKILMKNVINQKNNKNDFNMQQNVISNIDAIIKPKIKIGRNELCPCGSGRKYKHCCGKSI
jgi:tetratricopeptide (TPR) repeat protein